MSKLTKQAIKRLLKSPYDIRIINNSFKQAAAFGLFSRKKYELRVNVVHPLLEQFCGPQPEVEIVFWEGRFGVFIQDIPEELTPLIEEMKVACVMTNDEARVHYEHNERAMNECYRELGLK